MQSLIALARLTQSSKAWSLTSTRTTPAASGRRPTITFTIFRALASKPSLHSRRTVDLRPASRFNRLEAHPLPQHGRSDARPTCQHIATLDHLSQIAAHPELSQMHNVFVDNDRTLWLGCGLRLCHTNGSRLKYWASHRGSPPNLRIVFRDRHNTLWKRDNEHIRALAPGSSTSLTAT